jgi:L-threonylcarbamoyladenylate synthase
LTLVLRDEKGRFPEGARNERGGVAVRVSPNPFLRALLDVFGQPLVSTSANRAGEPAALGAQDLRALEGRPGSKRLWVADGGSRTSAVPSTIVDATGPRPSIVRLGLVPDREIAKVLGTGGWELAP